ncbi:MAG: HEPN domain-containing protein [Acidobacteriota bacterium]|nr:HEPN domain-containing protein [Acidobacteriota bacterium]
MSHSIIRPDIYESLKAAVSEGLRLVREIESQDKFIQRCRDFPKLEYFDSGLPRFSKSFKDEEIPKNYGSVFVITEGELKLNSYREVVLSESIPSWKSFWNLARGDSYLSRYWEPDEIFKKLDEQPWAKDLHAKLHIYGVIKGLVDRYVHMTGQLQFEEELFLPIYVEWELATFLPTLPVDVLVPLIFVMFSFDSKDLGGNISIERMSVGLQLARNTRTSITSSAHDSVIGAATHALVLKGWHVDNKTRRDREMPLYEPSAFSPVIPKIDNFLASIRAVSGVDTGYSQLLARPCGWADTWTASLPPVYAVSVRAYPDRFDNFGWLRVPPTIDEDACVSAGEIYKTITETPTKSLSLAARRLNAAFMRGAEEDSILDVTIGLEALLGDNSKTEMTHKLAMRLAALCKIESFKGHSPEEVFRYCKQLYSYRSAVAHGESKVEKKRIISLKEKETIPAVKLGVDLLSFALRVLSRNRAYIDPTKLDMFLIGGTGSEVSADVN